MIRPAGAPLDVGKGPSVTDDMAAFTLYVTSVSPAGKAQQPWLTHA